MREAEKKRMIELLDQNCGYVEEQKAGELADHLLENGVIVPPCKVGDTVWKIEDVWHLDNKETWEHHYEKEVLEFMVRSISISCNSKGVWVKKIRICQVKNGKIIDHQRNFEFDDLGKEVFFSEAEAKYALKNRRSVSLVNGHIEE
jgi:hypothetical protein